jgi:hypothetical protein
MKSLDLQQINSPVFGSRKYWSAVSALVAVIATFLVTKSEMLSVFTGTPFVGNVAAIFFQNMQQLKKNGNQ